MLFRYGFFLPKQFKNLKKFFELGGIITKSLVVLLVLGSGLEDFHNPIDFSIASMEDMSRGGSLSRMPLSASFMAAKVTSFGT